MRGANKEMNTAQTLEEVRKAISGGHKLLATVVWSDKASHRGPGSHLRVIRSDIDIFEPFLLHETSELVWIDYRVAARRRDTHFLHGKDLVCKSIAIFLLRLPYSRRWAAVSLANTAKNENRRTVAACHDTRRAFTIFFTARPHPVWDIQCLFDFGIHINRTFVSIF